MIHLHKKNLNCEGLPVQSWVNFRPINTPISQVHFIYLVVRRPTYSKECNK